MTQVPGQTPGPAAGPNWYDVLDVDPSASPEEVRDAWRAAIADLTPADRRFRLYNQAAEVLLDPERRAAYDAALAEQDAAEPETGEPVPAPATGPESEPDPGRPEEARPDEADEPAAGPARARRSWLVVPTWLLAVVALVTTLAVAATTYLWMQPSAASVSAAASTARSAAEQAVVPVLSYHYKTLEEDQQAAHAVMTSDYRERYDELFGVLQDNAPSTRTDVDVDVVASAITRVDEAGDRVQVLLFVDRPTTNKVTQQPVVYKDQATLTMELVEGRWLVDDLQTSPAQE